MASIIATSMNWPRPVWVRWNRADVMAKAAIMPVVTSFCVSCPKNAGVVPPRMLRCGFSMRSTSCTIVPPLTRLSWRFFE